MKKKPILEKKSNIFPITGKLERKEKEQLIGQRAIVIWLIGLSGSGKSTIAKAFEHRLFKEGYFTKLIDGDDLRFGINKDLGFSNAERLENLRRAAEIAKLFVENGVITICSFITPTRESLNIIRNIIGNELFPVFVKCPVEVCEERDVKGLYKKARAGEIPGFTGISAPFEEPENPFIVLNSSEHSLDECVEILFKQVTEHIKIKESVQ